VYKLVRVRSEEAIKLALECVAEDRGPGVLPNLVGVSNRLTWLARHLARYCWVWVALVWEENEEPGREWRLAGFAAVTSQRRRFGRLTGAFHFCHLRWVKPSLLVAMARELFRVIDGRLDTLEAYIRVEDARLKRLGRAFGFQWCRARRRIKGEEYVYGRRRRPGEDSKAGTGTGSTAGGTGGDARG